MGQIFDGDVLELADILRVRHLRGFVSVVIRWVLGCWADHDAPLLMKGGKMYVGDARPGGAVLTPLGEYERMVLSGDIEVRVCRVPGLTTYDRLNANAWWQENVLHSRYDYLAYPRLFLKAIFGDVFKRAAGWEWAWYCTEGCKDMFYNTMGKSPWGTNNPTPGTTGKRVKGGELLNIAF